MERNADDLLGGTSQGGAGSTGGSGLSGEGLGNSGNLSGTGGYGSVGGTADAGISGISGGMSGGSMGASTGSEGPADRAKELAGNAQEKLADVGSNVRERAGDAKNSLADMLATGAERLRERTGSGGSAQLAGMGAAASTTDNRMAQVGQRVAGGMESTADWLRDADIDSLRTGVEQQVKNHPGRTLLIAAGLGYLLGKAFRR